MNNKDYVKKVREAMGVKYRPQGRNLHGMDCGGLIVWGATELGYDINDMTNYPPAPDSNKFMQKILEHMDEVPMAEIQEGDCLVFEFQKGKPQHVTVITKTEPLTIIHAYAMARKVSEHILIEDWKNGKTAYLTGAFRFKGMEY